MEENPRQLNEVEDDTQQLDQPCHSQRDRRPPVVNGSNEFDKYGSEEFGDLAEVDHVTYNVCQNKKPATIKEAFASEHGK